MKKGIPADDVLILKTKFMKLKVNDGLPPDSEEWKNMNPDEHDDDDEEKENEEPVVEKQFYWENKTYLKHDIYSITKRGKKECAISMYTGRTFLIRMRFRDLVRIVYNK